MPLIERHWHEIAHYKDIPLDIDVEGYVRAEDAGFVRLYTMRHEGKLIGYALYLVGPNLHYKSSRQAKQDVLFVTPEHRGGFLGSRLVAFADECLQRDGVQVVAQHVKLEHPALGAVLQRNHYEPVEVTWMRRLDLPNTRRGARLGGEDANKARAAEMLSPGERADVEDEDAEHNDRRSTQWVSQPQ